MSYKLKPKTPNLTKNTKLNQKYQTKLKYQELLGIRTPVPVPDIEPGIPSNLINYDPISLSPLELTFFKHNLM